MAKEELTFSASATTVAAAAMQASETYGAGELEQHAEALISAWEVKLRQQTKSYVARSMEARRKGPGEELAGPFGPVWPLYPYWNLFLAGPFQPLGGGAAGPFMPHKIIRAADPTFMLGAIWRNPACVNWVCPAPSACELMSGWTAQIWLRTCNLTKCAAGPSFGPIDIDFTAYPNCTNFFFRAINFPAPPDGEPDLYEMNATVDITGPGVVSFAGYSTWVYDPDYDPFPPMPAVSPHWLYDRPVRLLVYTP